MFSARRLGALAVVGAILAGCAGTTPATQVTPTPGSGSPTESAAPPVATSTPTATATEAPTEAPTDTPSSDAVVTITQTFFKAWTDVIGDVNYEAVVEVTNTGGSYGDIHSGDESYTIYAKDGTVLQTGDFTYSFPEVIAPGKTGYFIDGGIIDNIKLATVGKFDPSITYAQADGPADAYAVSKVKVTQEDYGTGLQVSGVATNSTSTAATQGMVGVIFFDGSGKIIGGLLDNTDLGTLAPGQAKGFKTNFPGTPPLKPSAVKTFKAYAFDFSY